MTDVNWWLLALAFILGLALTFVLMVRRVHREVPVTGGAGGRSGAESEPAESGESRQQDDEQ
jgi:hypothetical protein